MGHAKQTFPMQPKNYVEKKDLHKFHLMQKKRKNSGVICGTILSHVKRMLNG